MLTRMTALVLSFGLLGAAGAAHDATPPSPPVAAPVEARMPVDIRLDMPIDRAKLRAALAKRRAKNLAAFRAYRKAGVYPHNAVRRGPLNVWMDEDGHLCAAATMISKDGLHDLAIETGKTSPYIRLQNVTEGPLLDWILTSGFTIEEIDRIQAPMVYPEARDYQRVDAVLAKGYAATERALVKAAKKSLDVAVNRLVQSPALARELLEG